MHTKNTTLLALLCCTTVVVTQGTSSWRNSGITFSKYGVASGGAYGLSLLNASVKNKNQTTQDIATTTSLATIWALLQWAYNGENLNIKYIVTKALSATLGHIITHNRAVIETIRTAPVLKDLLVDEDEVSGTEKNSMRSTARLLLTISLIDKLITYLTSKTSNISMPFSSTSEISVVEKTTDLAPTT